MRRREPYLNARCSLYALIVGLVLAPPALAESAAEVLRSARVYDSASSTGKRIGHLNAGDIVTLLAQLRNEPYVHVRLADGTRGFVYRYFLSEVEEAPTAGPPEPSGARSSSENEGLPESDEGADDEDFAGKDRRAAKTSYSEAIVEDIGSVADFYALFDLPTSSPRRLRTDQEMRALGISKAAESARLAPEDRNVRVHGFLYAAKHEEDGDYHVILCDSDTGVPPCLNVEVSGLAASDPARAQMRKVRRQFAEALIDDLPGSSYKRYTPALSVVLTGSLFFDVDHAAGVVGPMGHRPTTAWEVHPVSDMQFTP